MLGIFGPPGMLPGFILLDCPLQIPPPDPPEGASDPGANESEVPAFIPRALGACGPRSEDDERVARIAQWRALVHIFNTECKVYLQIQNMDANASNNLLNNIFAGKASGTLARRASSWFIFIRWAQQHLDCKLVPITEPLMYAYVEDLRITGALATLA